MVNSYRTLKIFCLFLLFSAISSVNLHSRQKISADTTGFLSEEISFLCDKRLKGRRFGTPGGMLSAIYVHDMLRHSGLKTRAFVVKGENGRGLNILGSLSPYPGGKYIVVLAHYDGLGEEGGNIYPSADANASGVVAMLELARRLSPDAPANFVFAALDGFNDGLVGASALTDNLASLGIRLSEIKMVLNFDSVGTRLAPVERFWKDYLIVLGGAPWQSSLEKCNNGLGLRLYYDYYGSRGFTDMFYRKRSDHRFLLEKGVPCVMMTSGITMNTNRVTDTPETIDCSVLERRITLAERWLRSISR